MAIMNQSSLANLLLDKYGALIVEGVTQYGPGNWLVPQQSIIGRLQSAGQVFIGGADGNDQYPREWGVHASAASAASFSVSDSWAAATNETYAQAKIGWKRVGITMEVDNIQRVMNAGGVRGSIHQVVNEFQTKVKALMSAAETQLASDGTGNSAKDLDGFKAFLSTGNTYAGIDQSANAYWRATVSAAGSASISDTLMQGVVSALFDKGAIGPQFEIWMGITQFQRFSNLHKDKIRYSAGDATTAPVPYYSDGGVEAPIRLIQSVPNSEVWFINLDDIELRFLPHQAQDELGGGDTEVSRQGVPIGIEPLNTGKDTKGFAIKLYANLVCKNPRRQGALTDLATS